ncbi:MAG: tetratricopeptide repeat protein [Tenuifilaceae bacterium]
MFRFFTIITLLIPLIGYSAKDNKIDSLYNRLSIVDDSSRIEILTKLTWELRNSEPNKSIDLGLEAIQLAEKYKDFKNLVNLHGFVGVAYRVIGNYSKSTDYYYKGLDLAKKHQLLELQGFAYINIANLFIYQEYYKNAIENLNNAFVIANKINNKLMLSYVHLNLGRANLSLKQYDTAMVDFNIALKLRTELNNKQGVAVCYKYIGDLYKEKGDYFLAIENYNTSQQLSNTETDKDLYANILTRKSELYLKIGKADVALNYAKMAYEIAMEIGAKLTIRDALKVITQVDKEEERFRTATGNLESIIRYNDTLFNQQLSEKLFFLEYQYEKQKKESEIEIKQLKLNRARSLAIALVVIIILLVGLISFVLASLRQRKRKNHKLLLQNTEISNQRTNIELKNKNLEDAYSIIENYIKKITDNIQYAERIQEALMPSLESAKYYFSDIFCFYKPKDFVSGDFYWISEKNNKVFFAVADCTGHGVPGALMSIIGLDMLNQALNQQNITEPDKILDYLNIELPIKMNVGENEMVLKDSMDIAICCFNKDSLTLSFSGALIPLTICRNGLIIEEKPSPISIGISRKVYAKLFDLRTIQLQKNDWIFLYTDGYIDQFGGEYNRKFLKKHLISLLAKHSVSNGENYSNELKNVFIDWKGEVEQTDDVLVLGLKV